MLCKTKCYTKCYVKEIPKFEGHSNIEIKRWENKYYEVRTDKTM